MPRARRSIGYADGNPLGHRNKQGKMSEFGRNLSELMSVNPGLAQ
jgi:hypothetical protein